MGLIHIPRTVTAMTRGVLRSGGELAFKGLSVEDPHIFTTRAGIFDVDYLGHLNNAAYLTHAELARWNWAASSGLLAAFARENAGFVSASTVVRYRQEIGPLFRKFEVRTSLSALDQDNMWVYQTFNYPKEQKIRAQALFKQAVIQRGSKLDPREFLVDKFGVPFEIVDQLDRTGKDPSLHEEILRHEEMEAALKTLAARDDARLAAANKE